MGRSRLRLTPGFDAAAHRLMLAEIGAGRRMGLAVSGGSDSSALLQLAVESLGPVGLRVATVDHGLRPEARVEAERVARRCGELGIPHDILEWVDNGAGGNLMARARQARHTLLADWASARGIKVVALGHTRDDVAETLLLGLARSAGLDGLGGMRARFEWAGATFLRPLLGASRGELRQFLVSRDLGWSDDPSNEDATYDRVRMRRALSLLADCGIDAARLSRSAAHLADDRASIRAVIHDWASRHARQVGGDLLLDRAAFAALPPSFARRILGQALRWLSGAGYPPRAASIARLAAAGRGTLHGCVLHEGRDAMRLSREPAAAMRARAVPLGAVWDGRWRVTGPHVPDGTVAALGPRGLALLPRDLRGAMPRDGLAAGPALWRGENLLAAPLADYGDHRAELVENRDDFAASLLSY